MNLSDIITKCFILALIIRDDGERLLLGDGFYEFKEQLQHFQPNTFQNDVIELQGTDGQLLAGQVRRGATQSFDGYIADSTTSREATEEHRQRFLGFFRKKHHYKVVYVFPDGSAIKRERGYIVDAPSVPEMFQRFPEFHVGLNFEDVNYYEYEEGEDGEEIFAHVQNIAIAGYVEGGLIWDNYGAVSNEITWVDYALKTTTDGYAQITDGVLGAPLNLTQLYGNATQELPDIYQEVEFIQSSGTQYIISDYVHKQDDYIEIKLAITASGDKACFGAYETVGGVAAQCELGILNSELRGNTAPTGSGYPYTVGTIYTVINQSGRWECNGTQFGFTINNNGTLKDFIFARNYSDPTNYKPASMKLYSLHIKQGGVLAYNFVPCYRKSDGVIGLYETVKQKFFTNSGTGTFTKGSDTKAQPTPDYPIQVQTVTGSQTVKMTGKNLINPDLLSASVYHNDFQTARYYYDADLKTKIKADTTYTLSLKMDNASVVPFQFSVGIGATSYAQDVKNINVNSIEGRISITFSVTQAQIDQRGNSLFMRCPRYGSPTIFSYTLSDIQLEITSNSFDSSMLPATWTNTTEVYKTLNLRPNTTYMMASNIPRANGNALLFFLEEGQTIGTNTNGVWDGQNRTLTTDATGNNLQLAYRSYSGETRTRDDYTYLLAGPTSFEPYQAQSYEINLGPIELAKIGTYRDRIYENDGEWYKHAEVGKVVLDGTEGGWTWADTTRYAITTANIGAREAISDHFTYVNYTGHATTASPSFDISSNLASIGFHDKDITSLNNFKTWLSTHNTTVYYPLATPTDTKITDQTLIQELSTIKALVGETDNIWLIPSSGAQGEMEVRYSRGFINQGAGYEWDAAQGGGPNVVSVDGIDRTGIVWEVVGPATNPTLTNITTNQTMTFEGDVATGQTLIVNTSDQTAEIAGTNVFAQMTGDWMQLAPGNNVITYTATGTTDSSTIKWNGVVG